MQVAAWIQLGMPDFALGVADKTIQLALIGLLAYIFVSERRSKVAERIETELDTSEMGAVR